MSALLSILFSKVGAYLAGGIGALLVLWRTYAAGKAAERTKADRQSLENVQERKRVDEDIARLDPGSVRQRLRDWSRR